MIKYYIKIKKRGADPTEQTYGLYSKALLDWGDMAASREYSYIGRIMRRNTETGETEIAKGDGE